MTDTNPAKPETPYEQLTLVDRRDGYAILTINRPEKKNSMSPDSIRRFREALADVEDMKAVILTGTGNSFCAGMDLKVASEGKTEATGTHSKDKLTWTLVQEEIRNHPAVFIAAVNGYALGGGSTLIHSCDLALAAESAQIGAPEMGFGGLASHAAPSAIKRLLPKHAAQILFLARRITGAEAYRMGFVNEVVPDDQLMSAAIEWAELLATYNPAALDYGKRAIHEMENMTWDQAMDYNRWIGETVRVKSTVTVEDMLKGFVKGERTPGQGA